MVPVGQQARGRQCPQFELITATHTGVHVGRCLVSVRMKSFFNRTSEHPIFGHYTSPARVARFYRMSKRASTWSSGLSTLIGWIHDSFGANSHPILCYTKARLPSLLLKVKGYFDDTADPPSSTTRRYVICVPTRADTRIRKTMRRRAHIN